MRRAWTDFHKFISFRIDATCHSVLIQALTVSEFYLRHTVEIPPLERAFVRSVSLGVCSLITLCTFLLFFLYDQWFIWDFSLPEHCERLKGESCFTHLHDFIYFVVSMMQQVIKCLINNIGLIQFWILLLFHITFEKMKFDESSNPGFWFHVGVPGSEWL